MADDPNIDVFRAHNHAACRTAALEAMRAACRARGLRLTGLRLRVMEILLESHRALGAYDVLRRLTSEGAQPQPPVAYRALDFLVKNGFAHRIERLNAYVACACPEEGYGTDSNEPGHDASFLICRECGAVAEMPVGDIGEPLRAAAVRTGFVPETTIVEVIGRCGACQEGSASHPAA
ncbi:MAG: transcriptional repressor [Paracoccaceae bacterium]